MNLDKCDLDVAWFVGPEYCYYSTSLDGKSQQIRNSITLLEGVDGDSAWDDITTRTGRIELAVLEARRIA